MGYFTNEIQNDTSVNNNSLKFTIEEIENELKNDKITFLFQTSPKTQNLDDSTIEINGNVYPLYCLKGKELVKIPFGWLKVDTLFLATWSKGGGYWLVKTMGAIGGGGGSSGVSSFNSRTGAVMPQTGDYGISNISGLQTELNNKSDTNHTHSHFTDTNNPHSVDKNDVALGNVDNTSDVNKPISTATQNALNTKADKSNVLELNNTDTFNPNGDYQPSTKKYVDDSVGAVSCSYLDCSGARPVITNGAGGNTILEVSNAITVKNEVSGVDNYIQAHIDGSNNPIISATGSLQINSEGNFTIHTGTPQNQSLHINGVLNIVEVRKLWSATSVKLGIDPMESASSSSVGALRHREVNGISKLELSKHKVSSYEWVDILEPITKIKLTSFTLDNAMTTPLTVSALQDKLANECPKFNINQSPYFDACVFDIYVNGNLVESESVFADITALVNAINTHNPNANMESNLVILSLKVNENDKKFSGIRGINAGYSLLKGQYGYSDGRLKDVAMGHAWADTNRNTNVINVCRNVLQQFYGSLNITDVEAKQCVWTPNGRQNLYNLAPTYANQMSVTSTTNSNVNPTNGRLCLNLNLMPKVTTLPQYADWRNDSSLVYEIVETDYTLKFDNPSIGALVDSQSLVKFYKAVNNDQGAVYAKPVGMDMFFIDFIPPDLASPQFFGLFEGVNCEPFIANLHVTTYSDYKKNVGGMFRKTDFVRNMITTRGDVGTIHKDTIRSMRVFCKSGDKIYMINRKIEIQSKRSGIKYKLMVV